MKFIVENLGGIDKAEIWLKPLTVFIGENGTGKTWTAYALAAMLGGYGYEQYRDAYVDKRCDFQYEPIETAIAKCRDKGDAHIDIKQFFHDYAERYFNEIARTLPEWLGRFMATRRVDFENLSIRADLSEYIKNRLDNLIKFNIKNEHSIGKKDGFSLNCLKEKENKNLYFYIKFNQKAQLDLMPSPVLDRELRNFIVSVTFHRMHQALFHHTLLFPTERTTFITLPFPGFQEPAQSIHDLGSWDNILGKTAPWLSYPVKGFLELLVNARQAFFDRKAEQKHNDQVKQYIQLAQQLEQNILAGKVGFEEGEQQTELIYHPEGTAGMELTVSASMIKELSPLVIYLKYLAKPGDLLVIDEPEMNLHPKAQAKLTEFLGMLVRAGLYVLITTHSPYIVDHLGNLIQAEKRENKTDIQDLFYLKSADAFLSPEDVSVYRFDAGTATPILDPEGDIDWESFGDVSREISRIYSELI